MDLFQIIGCIIAGGILIAGLAFVVMIISSITQKAKGVVEKSREAERVETQKHEISNKEYIEQEFKKTITIGNALRADCVFKKPTRVFHEVAPIVKRELGSCHTISANIRKVMHSCDLISDAQKSGMRGDIQ